MSQDTNVSNLIINKLTKAQYEGIQNPDPTQLYFVTDASLSSSEVITALGYTPADVNLSNLTATGESHFQVPLVSGTNIKTINGSSILGSGDIQLATSVDIDDLTITENSQDQLQAIGVINKNDITKAVKTWTGTKEEYELLKVQYLFAWTNSGTTVYTVSGTPVVSSLAYSDNTLSESYVISAVGTGTITATVGGQSTTFTRASSSDTNSTNRIDSDTLYNVNDDTEAFQNYPTRVVGQIIQSSIPLVDSGLHLLDGSLIQGSGIYADFVSYITGFVSSNYPDLFETEANWQASVSTYGVCGKFVYDSVNNTVRLPKITGFIEGTTDISALGDLVEAGLPNITGKVDARSNSGSANGAFIRGTSISGGYAGTGSTTENVYAIDFSASRSNSIYGNSTTVQPQTINVLYYIVMATSAKTNIQVDIDEIATDLNGKADVDLININNTGASRSAGWAMPSIFYDTLTAGASGTVYTAPSNGYFVAEGTSNTENNINHPLLWYLMNDNGTTAVCLLSANTTPYASSTIALSIAVRKGGKYRLDYGRMASINVKFIYAVGSESEAS